MHDRIEGSVKQHSAGTANVYGYPMLLTFPRHLLRDLEAALAEASDTEVTTEAIYEIQQDDEVAYIQFTGDSALFGNALE